MKEAQLERTSDPSDHLLIIPRLYSHHIGRKTQVFHFILIWPVRFGSTTFCHSWCTKAGCGKKLKTTELLAAIMTWVTWKGHLTEIRQCFGLWMKKLHKLSHDGCRFVNWHHQSNFPNGQLSVLPLFSLFSSWFDTENFCKFGRSDLRAFMRVSYCLAMYEPYATAASGPLSTLIANLKNAILIPSHDKS